MDPTQPTGTMLDQQQTQQGEPTPVDQNPRPAEQVATENAPSTGKVDAAPTPSVPAIPAAPPPPPKPMSRFQSGLADIFDDMADALAGRNRQVVYRDSQTGERLTQQVPQTRGQQWGQVVGEALKGAAAGAQAPQGVGQKLRAFGAGVQSGVQGQEQQQQQQEALSDEDFKAKRQTMMDNANLALLGVKNTAATFELGQAKVKALEGAADYDNGIGQHIEEMGGRDLGVVHSMDDLLALQKANPDLVKDHVNGRMYHAVNFSTDGNYDGMRYYSLPPEVAKQRTAKDIQVRTLIPGKSVHDLPSIGTYTIPAGSMTVGQAAAVTQAADDKVAGTQLKQYRADQAAAEKQRMDRASETRDYADAEHQRAQAHQLNEASSQDDVENNARQIYEGTADPSNLSKRSKTYDATLAAANRLSLAETGKPFDLAKAVGDYKFATQTSTYNTLNFLNSLTGRDGKSGNLSTIIALSDKLPRSTYPPISDVQQWAKLTLGNPQVAAYHAALTEVADQTAKILQGGGTGSGTSDAKLKQAQELYQSGFNPDQMRSVAGTVNTLLQNRRAEMIGTNRYLQRWNGGPTAPPPPPGMVTVQMPGQNPGHIPAANLAQFQRDHPNAKVIQ